MPAKITRVCVNISELLIHIFILGPLFLSPAKVTVAVIQMRLVKSGLEVKKKRKEESEDTEEGERDDGRIKAIRGMMDADRKAG